MFFKELQSNYSDSQKYLDAIPFLSGKRLSIKKNVYYGMKFVHNVLQLVLYSVV